MAVVLHGARAQRFLCLALALCGCGREAIEAETPCDAIAPGDLVITELHPNPDGSDGKDEYIEIYNASHAAVQLDGLTLTSSRADGSSPESHRLLSASIEAGAHLVLGNAPLGAMPPHLDYSYGDSLGALRNSDGMISLWCFQQLIDQVGYERTVDGRALELDGRVGPDHESNDLGSNWCAAPDAAGEAFGGNFGTPGAPNSRCEKPTTEGSCMDQAGWRRIETPKPGSVRIEEWMANPEGADAELEWLEARFDEASDLNGFQLGPAPDALQAVIQEEQCFPVDAGQRVVFGASPAAAPRVDAELGFSLGNSGLRSLFAGSEGVVLHRVDYDGTEEGLAWQLDPKSELCLARAEDEYASGNFGTPGAANPSCPLRLGPDECFDDGVPRSIVSPGPGEARITEWLANPAAVGNRDGEWVEIRFDAAVDLNGLVLSDLATVSDPIRHSNCLSVPADAHLVFARNRNPIENGGVDDVFAELPISLNNSDEAIRLAVDDELLDEVRYARSKAGVATQIDELGNVCDADSAFGDGDLGTPGLANPRCP